MEVLEEEIKRERRARDLGIGNHFYTIPVVLPMPADQDIFLLHRICMSVDK